MPLDWGRVRLATESLKGWFLALGLTPSDAIDAAATLIFLWAMWCIGRFGERKPDCSYLACLRKD